MASTCVPTWQQTHSGRGAWQQRLPAWLWLVGWVASSSGRGATSRSTVLCSPRCWRRFRTQWIGPPTGARSASMPTATCSAWRGPSRPPATPACSPSDASACRHYNPQAEGVRAYLRHKQGVQVQAGGSSLVLFRAAAPCLPSARSPTAVCISSKALFTARRPEIDRPMPSCAAARLRRPRCARWQGGVDRLYMRSAACAPAP